MAAKNLTFPAFMNQRARVQPKTALLFQATVAGITALLEDRLDVAGIVCGRRGQRFQQHREAPSQTSYGEAIHLRKWRHGLGSRPASAPYSLM